MRKIIAANVVVATLMLALMSSFASPAQAGGSFGLYLGRPGFGLYFGDEPRYRDRSSWRYRYGRDYDRGYRYNRGPRYSNNRSCSYWSGRCRKSWGYGNNNYRGCMHYYDCR